MSTTQIFCGFLIAGTLCLSGQQAQAQYQQTSQYQQAQYQSSAPTARMGTDPSTPALKYFGRGRLATMPQLRHNRPIVTPQPYRPKANKPFQGLHQRPTISPYLGLDAVETGSGLPNYYSRVLPLIEQQKSSQAQAANLRRLQQKVRMANRPAQIPSTRNGGVPFTGHTSQFLNSGGYFPGLQR